MGLEADLLIGILFTSEEQCGWPECDSWLTVRLDVTAKDEDGLLEVYFILCRNHLFDFIDKYVLKSKSNTILRFNDEDL